MKFHKPTQRPLSLRLSLAGLPGAGKTYGALAIARALVGPDGKVGVIDTERRSAERHHRPRGPFEFEVLELDDAAPQRYIEALEAATEAQLDAVIVDSLSHAWDGILDAVGNAGVRGWGKVRPVERILWDRLLGFPGHLIVTLRTKSVHGEVEDERGRKKQAKVATEARQREGVEYEFDVCLRLEDAGEVAVVEKTRCPALAGKQFSRVGEQVVKLLRPWLDAGVREEDTLAARIRELALELPEEEAAKARDYVDANRGNAAKLRQLLARVEERLSKVPPQPAAPPGQAETGSANPARQENRAPGPQPAAGASPSSTGPAAASGSSASVAPAGARPATAAPNGSSAPAKSAAPAAVAAPTDREPGADEDELPEFCDA